MSQIKITTVKESNKLLSLTAEVFARGKKCVAKAHTSFDETSKTAVFKYEGALEWAEDTVSVVNEWLDDNLEEVELPDWL